MRGFPPIQIVLLSVAFALLAIPLARLTSFSPFSAEAGEHADHDHDHEHDDHDHDHDGPKVVKGGTDHPEGEHVHEAVPALLRIRYAHKPLSLTLTQEGKELAKLTKEADFAASPIELKGEIGVSHEGNELIVTAAWPPGTPETALTVEIEPDGFESRSATRWASESQLDEVLTFQW